MSLHRTQGGGQDPFFANWDLRTGIFIPAEEVPEASIPRYRRKSPLIDGDISWISGGDEYPC